MYSPWLEYLVSIEVTFKTYSYLPYNCINSLCSLRVNDFVTANLESPAIYLCGLYQNRRLFLTEYTTTICLYLGG